MVRNVSTPGSLYNWITLAFFVLWPAHSVSVLYQGVGNTLSNKCWLALQSMLGKNATMTKTQ